ncbi:MAG: DUF4402 domain-containing protein [Bacteroidales bacterium]|nr:DUF4402 domain-containing protein [Bacteroidales bacterium]
MKTFKILFAALIIAGFATTVHAQQDTEVTASAVVLQELTVLVPQNVDFGNVSQNVTATLNPSDGVTTNAGTGAEFGQLTIAGAANTEIFISHPATVNLEHEGSGADLVYTPEMNFNTALGSGGNPITAAGSEHTLDGDGNGWVYIGGSLVVPETADTGEYTGAFDVTIVYN